MDFKSFRNDIEAPSWPDGVEDFEIVAWNGKERVPLVLDGIDHERKVIVLTTEPLTPYSDVQKAELQRRREVDASTHIETLADAQAYMADVLARGPIEVY